MTGVPDTVPGQFELLTHLGRGGMGVVWKARDTATGEVVALKLLHDLFAGDAHLIVLLRTHCNAGRWPTGDTRRVLSANPLVSHPSDNC